MTFGLWFPQEISSTSASPVGRIRSLALDVIWGKLEDTTPISLIGLRFSHYLNFLFRSQCIPHWRSKSTNITWTPVRVTSDAKGLEHRRNNFWLKRHQEENIALRGSHGKVPSLAEGMWSLKNWTRGEGWKNWDGGARENGVQPYKINCCITALCRVTMICFENSKRQ